MRIEQQGHTEGNLAEMIMVVVFRRRVVVGGVGDFLAPDTRHYDGAG